MASLISSPCLNCRKRHIKCHSGCLLYKQYKADMSLRQKEEQQLAQFENYISVQNQIKRKPKA